MSAAEFVTLAATVIAGVAVAFALAHLAVAIIDRRPRR